MKKIFAIAFLFSLSLSVKSQNPSAALQAFANRKLDSINRALITPNDQNSVFKYNSNAESVFKDGLNVSAFINANNGKSVFKNPLTGGSVFMDNNTTITDYIREVYNNSLSGGYGYAGWLAQIKQKQDTVNQNLRKVAARLISQNSNTAGDMLDGIYDRSGSIKDRLQDGAGMSAANRLKAIYEGEYGVTNTPPLFGYETWGEGIVTLESVSSSELQAINSKLPTIGQQTQANAVTVTFPSDAVQTVQIGGGATSYIVYASTLTPVASASMILSVGGFGTTSRLESITISGTQTTGGQVPVKLMRLTSAPTGGSWTNPLGYNLGTGAEVSNSTDVKFFTANTTGGGAVGTGLGIIKSALVSIPATTAADGATEYKFDFSTLPQSMKPILGTSNWVALCLNDATTITGGKLYITVTISR